MEQNIRIGIKVLLVFVEHLEENFLIVALAMIMKVRGKLEIIIRKVYEIF